MERSFDLNERKRGRLAEQLFSLFVAALEEFNDSENGCVVVLVILVNKFDLSDDQMDHFLFRIEYGEL